MSFNTDWDVEKYKTEHESEEHWELRKNFMLAHKDKFPEERVVCLAQVFFNVEFLGCRYPLKTMQLVAELSKGVADKFREQKQGKLQRTFVQASDAAGAKAKGLKRPAQESAPASKPSASSSSDTQPPAPNKTSRFSPPAESEKQDAKPTESITTIERPLQTTYMPATFQGTKMAQVTFGPPVHQSTKSSDHCNNSTNGSTSRFDRSRYGGVKTYHIDQTTPSRSAPEPISYGPYGKIVLIEPASAEVSAMETLNRSASVCKVKFETSYVTEKSGFVVCTIHMNGKFLSTGRDQIRKVAAKAAAEAGLAKLKESCYTIKVKHNFVSDSTIDKTLGIAPKSDSETPSAETAVSDNNIGNKLLRLMGWTGGGLGKDEQGIKEPVQVEEHVNRAGLGLHSGVTNEQQFRQKVFRLMKDYAGSNSSYDLVFSSEFSIEERKIMHEVATKLRLKTKSYGKNEDRHLVVFKRREMWETLEQLLQSGGSTEKYDLVKPSGPRSC